MTARDVFDVVLAALFGTAALVVLGPLALLRTAVDSMRGLPRL